MADYTPYAPGINAARSVWDQGIAPLAKGVQGFLKGTAGLPGAVKDYAAETVQSEAGPTTKVMVDLLTLGQGMRQGIREDPLRAMAEMYPPVGFGSDVFETGRLLKQAQNAEESGELEKAQTLRELANTIVLMGMVPGGPPAKKTIEQKLKDMEEKRRKLKEETGLPYVPNKEPPLPEGRRIDLNEPELDLLERERRLEQAAPRLDVGEKIPNQDSIASSLYNYEIEPEVKMLPMEIIPNRSVNELFYASDDYRRVENLADEIVGNNRIDPLIVVKDKEGFYVLEGAHRMAALDKIGAKEFPALVVNDLDDFLPKNKAAERRLQQARREPSPTVQESLLSDVRFSTDQSAPGMDFDSWNMINDPEHFIKSRGKITNIEQMSPSAYIERVSKDVFPTFGEAEIRQQRERTGKIPLMMEAMQEGTEFGLPVIHYDRAGSKFPSQEGLHRAMAAEQLGVPEIPVAIHQLDRSPAARAARAEEFGYTTDVYHATRADFSEFDPNMVDIGIHVGSPSQATNRLLDDSSSAVNFSGNIAKGVTRARNRFDEGSQILPLKAKINNVLEMPDVGEWKNSFNVIDELIKHPKFKHKVPELQEMRKFAEEEGVSYRDDYGDSTWDTAPENRELLNELNTLIRKEGFDTIKYLNEHENNLIRKTKDDPHSYIILDPKNVRSTSADFNPLRMDEADLQAGIASLGATEGMA